MLDTSIEDNPFGAQLLDCDGIMIGHGELGNPWIYQNLDDRMNDSRDAVYIPTVPGRKGLCSTLDCLAIERLIALFFDQLPADAPPPTVPILLSE